MSLKTFVKGLPSDLRLCPIEKKGVNGSTGKKPIYRYRDLNLDGDQVADLLETDQTISAVGLWTGTKGLGLVILDVDKNLAGLKRDKDKPLGNPPTIESTRKNAAKYIYRVPEEKWGEVDGFKTETFEVLWKNQGVIAGAYPGSSDGQYPEGEYQLVAGSFDDIPEIPKWLLTKMRNAKPRQGFFSRGRILRLTDRPEEVSAQMVFECLDAIPPLGESSYHEWIRIGMAVHSELPNETGLKLWTEFSKKDRAYTNQEEVCAQKWETFSVDGKTSFGTLSYIADIYDPQQLRFSETSKEIYEQIKAEAGQLNLDLPFEEIYRRMEEIYSNSDWSQGQKQYELIRLAKAADIRSNPVGTLKEIYMSHKESTLGGGSEERSAVERWDNPEAASYYVPGVFCAGVWLVSGRGHSGKTNACWAIARHFLSGQPLEGKHGTLTWEKGRVLWLTGDQPDAVIDDQIRNHLTREQCEGLLIKNNYDIEDYPTFEQYMRQHKPKLVVIDSLRSTSKNLQISENHSEFALPLRWYEQMMGEHALFQQCMIIVLHHSGHGRDGARGTSSLGDMTSFAANFTEPAKDSTYNPLTTRVMTFTKHRFGLAGRRLLCNLQADNTIKLWYEGEQDTEQPATVQDRIRLHFMRKPNQGFTVNQLVGVAHLACNRDNAKKAIQRMIRQGTAEVKGQEGKEKLYGAKGVVAGWVTGAKQSDPLKGQIVPENGKTIDMTEKNAGTSSVPGANCPRLDLSPDEEFWEG